MRSTLGAVVQCFCGCGRRVRLGRRAANVYGQNAQTLTAALDEIGGSPSVPPADWAVFLEHGRAWCGLYAEAVHGEIGLGDVDRDQWVGWRDIALGLVNTDHELAVEVLETFPDIVDHMDRFDVDDRVVLKEGVPGRNDHVGTVVRVDDEGWVWVKWEGPDSPPEPRKFAAGALVRA